MSNPHRILASDLGVFTLEARIFFAEEALKMQLGKESQQLYVNAYINLLIKETEVKCGRNV